MSDTPKAGDWVKALKPGTLYGGKFVKAGDVFQLGEMDEFSEKWMEPHEKPETATPPSAKDVKSEQEEAVREHEKTDAIRRGKFTHTAVPRSDESRERAEEKKKEDVLKRREENNARKAAQEDGTPKTPDRATNPAPSRAPSIDRGSASPDHPQGIHETSANPSRVDENAKRRDKE